MKKLVVFLFLIFLGVLGFFGFHKAPERTIFIIQSKWQGKKVLLANQWVFIPETIIPNFVTIEKIPETLFLQGKIKIDLPCPPLLSSLALCYAEVGYETNFIFQEQNTSLLFSKSPKDIQEDFFKRIENHVRQTLFFHLRNPNFTEKIWLEDLQNKPFKHHHPISYRILFLPHWQNFVQISKKMDLALSYASEKDLLTTMMEYQKKVLDFDFEMKKKQDQFNWIFKIAEKISLSSHKELIFKLLEENKGVFKE